MNISLEKVGKRFVSGWVFRNITLEIREKTVVGVSGPNGSGKSTFLAILCGGLPVSEGKLHYSLAGGTGCPLGEVFRYFSFAAPYTDVIEEMRLQEAIAFHLQFRPFRPGLSVDNFLGELGKGYNPDSRITGFSSGMKQRLKVALALYTDSEVVFLDEPTSNLDVAGVEWFKTILARFTGVATIVIASNVKADLSFCEEEIRIDDYSWPK